ncbi:hypothetical protein D3C80_1930700 [compost metagenome]
MRYGDKIGARHHYANHIQGEDGDYCGHIDHHVTADQKGTYQQFYNESRPQSIPISCGEGDFSFVRRPPFLAVSFPRGGT